MPKLTVFRGVLFAICVLGLLAAIVAANWSATAWAVTALCWMFLAFANEDRADRLQREGEKAIDLLQQVNDYFDAEEWRAARRMAEMRRAR